MLKKAEVAKKEKKDKSKVFVKIYDRLNKEAIWKEAVAKLGHQEPYTIDAHRELKDEQEKIFKEDIENGYGLKNFPNKNDLFKVAKKWCKAGGGFDDLFKILSFYEDMSSVIAKEISINDLWSDLKAD